VEEETRENEKDQKYPTTLKPRGVNVSGASASASSVRFWPMEGEVPRRVAHFEELTRRVWPSPRPARSEPRATMKRTKSKEELVSRYLNKVKESEQLERNGPKAHRTQALRNPQQGQSQMALQCESKYQANEATKIVRNDTKYNEVVPNETTEDTNPQAHQDLAVCAHEKSDKAEDAELEVESIVSEACRPTTAETLLPDKSNGQQFSEQMKSISESPVSNEKLFPDLTSQTRSEYLSANSKNLTNKNDDNNGQANDNGGTSGVVRKARRATRKWTEVIPLESDPVDEQDEELLLFSEENEAFLALPSKDFRRSETFLWKDKSSLLKQGLTINGEGQQWQEEEVSSSLPCKPRTISKKAAVVLGLDEHSKDGSTKRLTDSGTYSTRLGSLRLIRNRRAEVRKCKTLEKQKVNRPRLISPFISRHAGGMAGEEQVGVICNADGILMSSQSAISSPHSLSEQKEAAERQAQPTTEGSANANTKVPTSPRTKKKERKKISKLKRRSMASTRELYKAS
jgi:hypothetical protein